MEPNYYENAMVEFETKPKKRNRYHPGQISRAGPRNTNIIRCKGKNTKYNLKDIRSGAISHLQGAEVSQRNWRLENGLGTTHLDKYLMMVLQLLGTSSPGYNNNCITKLWSTVITFSSSIEAYATIEDNSQPDTSSSSKYAQTRILDKKYS